MRNNFVITTTNSVEGIRIIRYLDVICTNVVIGTNVFSDFTASLSDLFGGHSGTYKKKLNQIYEEATEELKEKARIIGANAIVGFNVDFDEVSGGGKSMFMISVSGTACIVDFTKSTNIVDEKILDISKEALAHEMKRMNIISSIKNGNKISRDWMEFLIQYPQLDVLDELLKTYMCSNDVEFIRFMEKYVTLLPKEDAIKIVYDVYNKNKHSAMLKSLIINCDLFSPIDILNLLKCDLGSGLELLNSDMPSYSKDSLSQMNDILNYLDDLPDTGRIEFVSGGFMSKSKDKFICQNGHKNDKDLEYCSSCGLNIKGLEWRQVDAIEKYRRKIEALNQMLQ